jgi:hypothetical protein
MGENAHLLERQAGCQRASPELGGENTMITILNGFVCLLLILQFANAQQSLEPKILTPASSRDVLAPPFTFWANPACDEDGNMYFHVGGSAVAEILRLSADASEGQAFKVSNEFPEASGFGFSDFSVSPSGDVYVLGGARGKITLLRFDKDGTMSEPI